MKRGLGLFLVLLTLFALAIANKNIEANAMEINIGNAIPQIRFVLPTPLNDSENLLPISINYTATAVNLQSAFIDLNRTLVLWLRMNGAIDENATHVRDWSSYGNNGTAINGANLTTAGKLGSAYIFGGNDEEIDVPDKPEFSPFYYNITIAFWLRPDTFDFVAPDIDGKDALHFLSKGSPGQHEWAFRLYNRSNAANMPKRISFNQFALAGGVGAGSYFQDNLTEGEWIHVTGVINGTQISVYKDGILRDQDTLQATKGDGIAPVRIGRRTGGALNGSIDDVMIFNRVLSNDEIIALYNATQPFITSHNLPYGNYTLKASAQDLGGNVNSTEEIKFAVVNTTNLNVILISPTNNTVSGIRNVSFVCNSTNNALSNMSLYTDTNGSWSANEAQAISGAANQSNFTVSSIKDGTYLWNCLAKDDNNNHAYNTTNNTIFIDTIAPLSISLFDPDEGYSSTSTAVIFNLSAIDNQDTNLACNITMDSLQAARINISNGTAMATTITVSTGSHQWNATCYDNALNKNSSLTRNFTITQEITTPSGSGTSESIAKTSSGGGGASSKSIEPFADKKLKAGDTIEVGLAKENKPLVAGKKTGLGQITSDQSATLAESITGSMVENVTIKSNAVNDKIKEENPKDLQKTGLLAFALILVIIYGKLLEQLMRNRILGY